jgi:hypothetical protein
MSGTPLHTRAALDEFFNSQSSPDVTEYMNDLVGEVNFLDAFTYYVHSLAVAGQAGMYGDVRLSVYGDLGAYQDAGERVIYVFLNAGTPTRQRYPVSGYIENTANDGEVEVDVGVAVAEAHVAFEEVPLVGIGEYGEAGDYGEGVDLDATTCRPKLSITDVTGSVVTVRYENWPVASGDAVNPGVCFTLLTWQA